VTDEEYGRLPASTKRVIEAAGFGYACCKLWRDRRANRWVRIESPVEGPEKSEFNTPYCGGPAFIERALKWGMRKRGEADRLTGQRTVAVCRACGTDMRARKGVKNESKLCQDCEADRLAILRWGDSNPGALWKRIEVYTRRMNQIRFVLGEMERVKTEVPE